MCDTTTLFDDEDKQLFAEIIIDFIENQHQELAKIHFRIIRLGNGSFSGIGNFNSHTGIHRLQVIAKMQGKPNEDLLRIAQRMLDLFCTIGEIEKYAENLYGLSPDGALYKHLAEKLERTL